VTLEGAEGARLTLRTPGGPLVAYWRMPGLYNVYNALAGTAACLSFGVSPDAIRSGLETFTAAFGRLERVPIEGRLLYLALVKNPVGFTEVLRTVTAAEERAHLLILINDLFADGTDVSLMCEVDFDQLDRRVASAVSS
jgi:UDP-N-acetylmuramyl tripeptide synthase